MKPKILIVEDQFIEAHALERVLIKSGYAVCDLARSVQEALRILDTQMPDLVLLDIYLQGRETGIDLARKLLARQIPFVYLSANSNEKILEEAKLTRPNGFLVKPFREKDILIMLDIAWYLHKERRLLEKSKAEQPADPRPLFSPNNERRLLGKSPQMTEVFERIGIVADVAVSVLILGESGTGKELVARDIHRLSDRRDKPFVAINCAAMPGTLIESILFGHEKGAFTGALQRRTGKFEEADGGTIFLDEIGELPVEMQAKLLRTLQEKEIEPIGGKIKTVDVRVIAATNRKLEEEISLGRFRMDLYFRLNVFPISLPPLRERPQDISLLARHFVERYSKEIGKPAPTITDNAMLELLQYNWPGNVRELENVIHKNILIAKTPVLDKLGLQEVFHNDPSPEKKIVTIADNERNHILLALERCEWRVAGKKGAAAILDIKVSTLTSRMKKLGIRRPSY